jgi:cyanuric acid amidohydrolase
MSVVVESFDTVRPDDVHGLALALDRIGVDRIAKLAVFLKVEGDYDDGSRERARGALEALVDERGLSGRTQLLTAVGCEGVSTPFGYMVADLLDDGAKKSRAARMVLGFGASVPLESSASTGLDAIDIVAATVRAAASDAGLAPSDVVMVFVKVPQGAPVRGEKVRGRRARALAALGAGVALGEIAREQISERVVATDLSLYCRRVQAFGGLEVSRVEAIVLGNRAGAGGALVAHAGLMRDLIDGRALRRLLTRGGLTLDADGELAEPARVAAFFLKAGPSSNGNVRGARTTIYTSSITPEKHMRAAVSGVVGALLGTTRTFTTGDPVHQGPEGGGVACALIRTG